MGADRGDDAAKVAAVKLIYIAGPYKSTTDCGIFCNIQTAREAALDVWELGHAALCPHSNTAFFGGERGIPDSRWYEGDLEMLRRCDGVYLVHGWQHSPGAIREVELARKLNMPVYETREELTTAATGWPIS